MTRCKLPLKFRGSVTVDQAKNKTRRVIDGRAAKNVISI